MQDIKQLLCVVDPTSTEQHAVRRAAWLAEKCHAQLELFICYYNEYLSGERLFDSPSLEKTRQEIIQGHKTNLEEMAAPLRESGLAVTTTALWDHPLHEGIVRHAAATGADIVFKDTHHHSAISRALLTNTDWNLIRSCASTLWLVKPGDTAEEPVWVAAVDPLHEHDKPAELDDDILQLGSQLAQLSGGELHAFHSYDPRMATVTGNASAYLPVTYPFEELEQQIVEDHKKKFNATAGKHDIASDKLHLVAGLIHEELPRFCKEINADVVVMGAVSRNRWKRFFIGATAERTLEHLPCDLLIVKQNWFEIPEEISRERAA
ncbi:MAG: universal stress protein [Woeseiaceae bacterium]|nr:universal stress protein [Woeseiaceae bacterium]